MQYMSVVLPLAAMVSGAFASPAWGGDSSDACLAAVTGSAALGDKGLRASHCASYLATTVTPIVTETVTITGSGNDNWKRATVAYCPNEVPNYASACNDAAYTSACSKFGFTNVITTTVAPTTTTKTIWVKPTGGAGGNGGSCSVSTVSVTATSVVVKGSTCPAGSTSTTTSTKVIVTGTTTTETVTKNNGGTCTASTQTVTKNNGGTCTASTETVTKNNGGTCTASTVTVTKNTGTATTVTVATATTVTVTSTKSCSASSTSSTPSSCKVDDALATKLVTNFVDLLQHTSYAGNAAQHIPAGSGYHYDVSAATLSTDFIDISDSINFMAGFPLGSITFNGKAAFDYGQGTLQPEVGVNVLNIWHDCDSITWRWQIYTLPYPVTGINHMLVNKDGLVYKNYAEFDSGAWLQGFGKNCSANPIATPQSPPATKRGLLDM